MAFIFSLLIGLVIGVVSGALGVGGGGIIVPVLVLVLGIDQATAQGTSLLAIIPTAASGAVGHWRERAIDLRVSALLGSAGAVGAVAGALAALHVEHRRLREAFAAYLFLVGAQTLYSAVRKQPRRD
jgi:uncharacterized membrane protein YfcA